VLYHSVIFPVFSEYGKDGGGTGMICGDEVNLVFGLRVVLKEGLEVG
jgi:hypothetical protein